MKPRPDIVHAARSWIGTPYVHQGSLRGVGCDCLGLVRGVWRDVMGDEPERAPPYTADWAEAARAGGAAEPLLEAAARHLQPADPLCLVPGDVLAFRWRRHLPAKHIAILSAPDRMIHAHDGACVCEVALSPWWSRRIAAAYRFPENRRRSASP